MPSVAFTSALSPCPYLPDRDAQLRYEFAPLLTAAEYEARLKGGWRRFGAVMFRPECPSCSACQSIRVPVATFVPTSSQRRVWKRNEGQVDLRIVVPASAPEKLDLLEKFHRHGHEAKGWPAESGVEPGLFLTNPFTTEEWDYWVEGRLAGVGYVDALAEGLSAIYFFHDPAEGRRSLGTFNILKMIEVARQRGLPHVYLGYYVEGYRSLAYKARFGPGEVLRDGRWTRRLLAP